MIKSGLSCPEFIEGYGDGKYLFSNMVAKYTLSNTRYRFTKNALERFISMGYDVNKVYTRNSLYGKKSPFIFEHSIPASVVRKELINNPTEVDNILDNSGEVLITLREEDEILTSKGYQSTMCEGWEFGDNPLVRYEKCGIEVSDVYLTMKGAIKR